MIDWMTCDEEIGTWCVTQEYDNSIQDSISVTDMHYDLHKFLEQYSLVDLN